MPDAPDIARRTLVVGRSPEVMASILSELTELGHVVEGSTEPERAADSFAPDSFDLVFVGRGVTGAARDRLRAQFAARHPAARVVDCFAQGAVRQIADALEGRGADVDLDAYFARIGYDGPRDPTLATLAALQRAHQAAIPFEAIDLLLGRVVDVSAPAVDAKLIAARRGGFCYEQNGLFKRVLAALGFEVDGLLARVRMGLAAGAAPAGRTHMTLRVTVEGSARLVDVGFGAMVPPAPLRLDTPEPQETGHEAWRIAPFGPFAQAQARVGDGWEAMYDISPEPQVEADYAIANWFTCTHPSSFFRRDLVAARIAREARYALLGRRLTVRRPGRPPERAELDAAGIERALSETFALTVEPDWRPLIARAATGDGAAPPDG